MTANVRRPSHISSIPLSAITGDKYDPLAISDLGYAILANMYEPMMLRTIAQAAQKLRHTASTRFLNLNMLRSAHLLIPSVDRLTSSAERLKYLSDIASTRLEPYPISVANSHINFYSANRSSIDFHSDGAAIVEIIPLDEYQADDAATLIFRGRRDEAPRDLRSGLQYEISESSIIRIPHIFGKSVLLQGRRLFHAGSITSRDRALLVIAMRSVAEPWKDDNTIARLAMDYEVDDFLDEWIRDELECKLPAYRSALKADEK